jgi:hypothetical protein
MKSLDLRLNRFYRSLGAALCVGLVLWARPDKTWGRAENSLNLVQIEFQNPVALSQFAATDIPIYTEFWSESGITILIAELKTKELNLVHSLGSETRILDSNPEGGIYYLAFDPLTNSRLVAPKGISILAEINQQFLIRANPVDAENLLSLGFKIQHLHLHPFRVPWEDNNIQASTDFVPNSLIQSILDQVDPAQLAQYVGDLSGEWEVIVNENPYTFFTRYSYAATPIKKATKYVYEHFAALGLTTYYDHFFLLGNEMRSVIGEQPSATGSDCIVLIIGHLDSYSVSDPYGNAPGADDNASGSAGVLAAADILHQHQFGCTLRYILFTAEEQGYYGSLYYAQDVAAAGENIIAVINLDMIGYNGTPNPIVEFHIRPDNSADLTLATMMTTVISAYEIDIVPEIIPDGLAWSDHSRFWEYGYPAILVMEDKDGDFTPYYHSTNDRLASLDLDYIGQITQAAIGSAIHLAGYLPPTTVYLPLILSSP